MGSLASLGAPELGAQLIKSILEKSNLDPQKIDEVYMGCVLTAGLGQAPARQAALKGGLSDSVPCTTIGKVCGSGLKAVMLADLALRSGEASCVVAGGMESMSQAPYLVPKMRDGLRLGHGELVDSMIKDGLWDVYNNFHMGAAAEMCVREFKITREEQDEHAKQSYLKAQNSVTKGIFKDEISAIEVTSRKGPILVENDEEPFKTDLEKFSTLRPVFDKNGSVTAANASTLNDGAAAMIVCTEAFAKTNNLTPIARIVAQSQSAQKPEWFTTAPALSMELLLKKAEVKKDAIDFWEINEAFSAVALANIKLLGIDPARVNVRGGSVALGHPIGASGARILTTLCHALKQQNKKYGMASLCIGGGEAVSLLVEKV